MPCRRSKSLQAALSPPAAFCLVLLCAWAMLAPPRAVADSKTWLFTNSTDGWIGSSGTSVTASGGSNLHVVFATGGGIYSNDNIGFTAAHITNQHDYIRFGYRLTSGNIAQFRFNFETTSRANYLSPDFNMPVANDGNWHWITYPVDQIGDWRNSTIRRLRFVALASNLGGASGTLDLDYCFLRLDDSGPYPPSITTATTGDWVNHSMSVSFSDNDPPPNGFPNPVGPDVYGSGVDYFYWHINSGPDTQRLPDTFDPSSGTTTATVTIPTTAMQPGYNTFHVYAFDRVGLAGSDDHSFIVKYDPNPPGKPIIVGVSPPYWSSDNLFAFYWNDPGDDWSGVSFYDWQIDDGDIWSSWYTYTAQPMPSEGAHRFRVRARDSAGNIGPWSDYAYAFFDDIPPIAPPVMVAPSGYATQNSFTFSWPQGYDGESAVYDYYYSVDGGDPVQTFALSVTLTVQQIGQHTFDLWAEDEAGNISVVASEANFYYFPLYGQPIVGLTPSGGQVALPQTFWWVPSASQYQVAYVVQVAADANFTAGVQSYWTNVPWFTVPAAAAPNNGQTYYWHVMNAASFPPNWSTTAQFSPYVPPPPTAAQVIGQDFPSGEAGEGVNTAVGAVTRNFTILTLRGPGGDVPLEAWYSSQSQRNSILGPRWNCTLGQLLTPSSGVGATVTLEDNQDLSFAQTETGYSPGLGIYDSLASTNGAFVLVRPSRTKLNFDYTGLLQSIADRNGNAVTLQYAGGLLNGFTDPAGRQYSVWTQGNRVTQIRDESARTWQFEYNGAGYLAAFTDAKGARTVFEYDGQGRLTHVVDPLGHDAIRYTYDDAGRVATQTDAYSKVTTFTYDDPNRTTMVTDPRGAVQKHVRDVNSRLVTDIDELGNTTTYEYDANHNRIAMTDARGKVRRYSYDPRGNIYQAVDALAETTTTLYDYSNNPVSRQEPYGKMTVWVNDERGNPTSITDALGFVTRLTYNAAGQVTELDDANHHVTRHQYDGRGERTSTTDGAGDVTNFGYDAVGRRTTTTYPALSQTTSYAYDPDDSLLSVTNSEGEVTSYEYDLNGNRTGVVDPLQRRTSSSFDNKNRLVQVTDALADVTRYEYDEIDRRTKTTDPRGNVTTSDYDAAGNLLTEHDPAGFTTTYTYDANHNRLTTTDERGKTTRFTYDALNRRLTTKDPLDHVASTEYDSLGRVVRTTNARLNATDFTYDLLDRLTAVHAPTGGLIQYGYDAVGNRVSVTNANQHATTMTYDGADRLLTTRDPLGDVQTYSYDAAGRRLTRVDGRGRTTFYLYDRADRLTRTTYDDSSKIIRTFDAAGNLLSLTDQWGTATYTYDNLNRITASTDHYGQSLGFAYDPAGNQVSITYPGGQVCRYAYDPLNRLASLTDWNDRTIGYGYDAAGNNTGITQPNGVTTTQVFDDASRLSSILVRTPAQDTLVSFAYTLDEDGNRTRIVRVDRREDPQRLGGPDVFGTSAALSSQLFAAGSDSVVLASGEAWEEAVTAPLLARKIGAPALVVPGDNLWASSATQAELARLKSLRPNLGAVVLGDIGGISPIVEAQLQQQGMPVRRARGGNRFDTSVRTAAPAPDAVLLGGADPSRAGAAALLAARRGSPLLLTDRDSIPATVQAALTSLGAGRTILVGDEGAIGPNIASWLNSHGHPVWKRYSASDISALSVQVLDDTVLVPDRVQTVRLANRDVYQDALSAAAEPSPFLTPTLLASPDSFFTSPDLVRWLGRHKGWLQHAVLLGPTSALGSNLEAELRTALRAIVTDYTYSPLDELTSEIIPGVDSTYYTYDPVGNRASTTHNGTQTVYTYDGADRLATAGNASYGYDANGNRLTRTTSSATTTYSYDFENRLFQIVGPEGMSSYRYDGLGRRIRTQEPGRIVRYVLDPTSKPYRTLRETDDIGTTQMNYTHGSGVSSEVGPTGVTRFYHYDGLGSTAAITDGVGTDVAHLGFAAFGDTALMLGNASTRLGYIGRYGVEGTASGLQFMQDRFYDVETGAFLSEDPDQGVAEGFFGSATYLYALGNPVDNIDPDGHNSIPKKPKQQTPMANQDAALLKQALAAYKANPGGAAGGDCYYWVNQQLKKASSNKVSLPGLAKDAKGGYTGTLKSNPHFQKTGETFADAKPGQIIEMVSKAKNGTIYPHTAVIVGVNKKGLVVIDSNWHLNDHLDSHIIPATTFTSPTTRGHYTIYDAKW